MTIATEALRLPRAPAEDCVPVVVALSLLSGALMLGGATRFEPGLALAACAVAFVILLLLERARRRVRWTPHPVFQALERAALVQRDSARARPLYVVRAHPSAGPRPGAAAPLQALAQAQGDQRFLMECRRNVSDRWLLLLQEMESAWARRRIGDLRWPLYQLRMQSALWGAEGLSRQSRELERLLERDSILGFEYRCGRALAGLRATLEGRPAAH